MRIRRHGRRFAWLMIGAAIGTTVVLVLGLGIPRGADGPVPVRALLLGAAGAVLIGGLLGLVPGVRELEVTGARSMLGVESELVVPRRPGLVHRFQDVVWVQLHLLLGLLAAGCLTMLLPASAVLTLEAVRGTGPGTILPIPSSLPGRVAAAVLGLLGVLAALGAAIPLGGLAAHFAPRLLGPTARDRLEVALARADREADRIRIARDLHDGIGHALTIVSIQAAAGRRVLERDPDAAGEALERIEATSRGALDELDAVLGQLRDDTAGPQASAPSDPRLQQLLADHRAAGMDLRAHISLPAGMAPLQREHVERMVAELLTNAHRHGAPGAVRLEIDEAEGPDGEPATMIMIENPLPHRGTGPVHGDSAVPGLAQGDSPVPASAHGDSPIPAPAHGDTPAPAPAPRGGRGLGGMRERLELWGGTLEAGPHDGTWRARVLVPMLTERTEP